MPFLRPAIDELRARSTSSVQTKLKTGPLLVQSVPYVLAQVLAGHTHGLHGHLAWAARQGIPTTADEESLAAIASMYGIARKSATFASGAITITGVNGSTLPFRKRIRRTDGVEFVTAAAGTIAGGTATVPVQALTEGAIGNTGAGVAMTITSPVTGISSSAMVASSGIAGGTDAEGTEELRARVLQRTRSIPAAGSTDDFVRWTLEVPGVTRAWCFPRFPAIGSAGVTFATDDEPTGPIPSAAKVAEVTAYLEARRPVGGALIVFAPIPLVVSVNLFLTPNTAEVRAAVEAELRSLFRRQSAPGETFYASHIREAISGAAGEIDHTLDSPVSDVVPEKGQLPVLGSLTVQ